MSKETISISTLQDPGVPVRAKLAASWTSFMFLYIHVDYRSCPIPAAERNPGRPRLRVRHQPNLRSRCARSGAIPIVMIVLSMTLPARVSRARNLVVATLYIPYSMFNVLGAGSWILFYGLGVVLEVILLAYSSAPQGPGPARPHSTKASRHVR